MTVTPDAAAPTRIHGHHAARFALVTLALLPAVATLAVLLLEQTGRLVDSGEFRPAFLLVDLALLAGIALGALGFARRSTGFALAGAGLFIVAAVTLYVNDGAVAAAASLVAAVLLVVLAFMPTSRATRRPAAVPPHSP